MWQPLIAQGSHKKGRTGSSGSASVDNVDRCADGDRGCNLCPGGRSVYLAITVLSRFALRGKPKQALRLAPNLDPGPLSPARS